MVALKSQSKLQLLKTLAGRGSVCMLSILQQKQTLVWSLGNNKACMVNEKNSNYSALFISGSGERYGDAEAGADNHYSPRLDYSSK